MQTKIHLGTKKPSHFCEGLQLIKIPHTPNGARCNIAIKKPPANIAGGFKHENEKKPLYIVPNSYRPRNIQKKPPNLKKRLHILLRRRQTTNYTHNLK
jgi:hypothetical protein